MNMIKEHEKGEREREKETIIQSIFKSEKIAKRIMELQEAGTVFSSKKRFEIGDIIFRPVH